MTLGFPTDKANIDGKVGTLALTLRDVLDEIQRVKVFLDSKQDSDLTALGYSSAEVATLKSAFTDMNKLANIAHGQDTQAQANDFFFWARNLTGLN